MKGIGQKVAGMIKRGLLDRQQNQRQPPVQRQVSPSDWLQRIGMSQYLKLFQDNGFLDSIYALKGITESVLDLLDIKIVGHRLALLSAVNELNSQTNSFVPANSSSCLLYTSPSPRDRG